MILVKIRNISGSDIQERGGVDLPPPFHLLTIPAGQEIDTVCTMEQMNDQWPHRSGFKVSDLLQQLVQRDVIRVDIQPYREDAAEAPKIEEVKRKLRPPKEKAVDVEQTVTVAPDETKEEPMSNDIPDFTDPLYNAPKAKKSKKTEVPPVDEPEPTSEPPSPSGMGIDIPATG